MSKVQMLRSIIDQRLTAAVEEIFELFRRTAAEYEEQICRLQKENERQQKLLETVFSPRVHLHRADDLQQLVIREAVSAEHQDRSHSPNQENPELPHIKEEQEEACCTQEPEEADVSTFTSPLEKNIEDKTQSSKFQQAQSEENRETERLKTEAEGEDFEGPEPDRDFYPHSHYKVSPSSKCESDDLIYDWKGASEPESGGSPLRNSEPSVGDKTGDTSVSSSECPSSFEQNSLPQELEVIKPFKCSMCGKNYSQKKYLTVHMIRHTEGYRFICPVCKKRFPWKGELLRHMKTHPEQKTFNPSVCDVRFTENSQPHTGEMITCLVCKASFPCRSQLDTHMRTHTGERPFHCAVCGRRFSQKGNLKRHSAIHTGEKPFRCPLCEKRFSAKQDLKRHLIVHTAQKQFSCSVCDKKFTWLQSLKKHICPGVVQS